MILVLLLFFSFYDPKVSWFREVNKQRNSPAEPGEQVVFCWVPCLKQLPAAEPGRYQHLWRRMPLGSSSAEVSLINKQKHIFRLYFRWP